MSIKSKLTREIIWLVGASAVIALFFFGFLYFTASSIISSYWDSKGIFPTDLQIYTANTWLFGVSLAAAVLLFIILFLVLLGQKLAYLRTIIEGVDTLRAHRMDHTLPLEGNNELTELAASINYLSATERHLKKKETLLQQERETFIRSLSHDIRTPLTSIFSYSQYMKSKDSLSKEEVDSYLNLMQGKAEQIKRLTDQLLQDGFAAPEPIEDGKLLMQQLTEEWLLVLEDRFRCTVDTSACPAFSGSFHIGELQRIFDNLASNVIKYADPDALVTLTICAEAGALAICQKNAVKSASADVESSGIGLESIRQIAARCGGALEVSISEHIFCIKILLAVNL